MSEPQIHVIEWTDLKQRFIKVADEGKWAGQPELDSCAKKWKSGSESKWYGAKLEETLEWLKGGYFEPAFIANMIDTIPKPRKRVKWQEDEGELDPVRFLCGREDFYLGMAKRDGKPGLALHVNMTFSCGVNAKVIAEYGAWVTSFIRALETRGYDLEVTIDSPSTGLFVGRGREHEIVRVKVKRFNEISDFTAWSVMFSPTGFRHVMFTAFGLAGENAKLQCAMGLGHPKDNNEWSVTQDPETATITVGCNSSGDHEVKEKLTAAALETELL